MSVEKRFIEAESPFAAAVGYSRAVRVGPHIYVAGTAPIMPRDEEPPADAYGQAKRCLEVIVAALRELGAAPENVVRTRVFLTSADDWPEVGRAHGEIFGEARPASAMLVVAGLLDPRWRVEIEADALLEAEVAG